MLKGIDPVLGPDLLAILRAMGHGDEIVIADANFPAAGLAQRLARADGVDAVRMTRAICALLPLDDFTPAAAFRMAVVDSHQPRRRRTSCWRSPGPRHSWRAWSAGWISKPPTPPTRSQSAPASRA